MGKEFPKRSRFQVHLSTAIVLMSVAGLLVLLNVKPRYLDELGEIKKSFPLYGWPLAVICDRQESIMREPSELLGRMPWGGVGLAVNLATAGVILYALGFACERRIRRRTKAKNRLNDHLTPLP